MITDPVAGNPNARKTRSNTYEIVNADGSKETFIRVDKMPQAEYDIIAYLSKQLTLLSSDSNYTCPKTIVQFTIEVSGVITHPRILKSCNPQLDEQILSAIRKMPKWQPAEQKGKPIAIRYSLPILIDIE